MVIHKRTRLTPIQRREIYEAYHQKNQKVSDLATSYHVSRPTIYKILHRGRKQDFTIHSSRNKRFACLRYGIKRLSKIEKQIEERLKKQAKRYNKDYPGQMLHGDTKRLPLLEGQKSLERREYLFVAIDDFSPVSCMRPSFRTKPRTRQRLFWSRFWKNAPIRLSNFTATTAKNIGETPIAMLS